MIEKTSINIKNGLISPLGQFYPCEDIDYGFIELNKDFLKRAGWIYIYNGQIHLSEPNPENQKWNITEEQYDTLKEYIQLHPDTQSFFYKH